MALLKSGLLWKRDIDERKPLDVLFAFCHQLNKRMTKVRLLASKFITSHCHEHAISQHLCWSIRQNSIRCVIIMTKCRIALGNIHPHHTVLPCFCVAAFKVNLLCEIHFLNVFVLQFGFLLVKTTEALKKTKQKTLGCFLAIG